MGPMNWPAIALGTVVFFAIGALWYGLLFGKLWQREVAAGEPPRGGAMARTMIGTVVAELVVVLMLGHLFARIQPSDQAKMMMAAGFGLAIMTPAIAINYLHQRKSLVLFLIDAGHVIAGMTAVGLVFVMLG